MKFLVLGATGRTGVLFVKKALDEGHQVTALVRRADADVDSHAQVVSGDVTDAAVIAAAARGHDAIISRLGVKNARGTPTLITDTVRAVIASAKTSGVDRFVIVSAFGVGNSLAKASFLVSPIFRTVLGKTYADKAASEALLRDSDLKWTLEYPGALNDKDTTFFLKFCSYFPYNAKLCINGNHWAQRHATKAGLGYVPLDNAFAQVDDPAMLRRICDELGPRQIRVLLDK